MTRTHFTGPRPAEDLAENFSLGGRCLVCLMCARGAEPDALEKEILELERDGKDNAQKWFAWPEGGRGIIRLAVVDGISDILPPGYGLVPLCWDHLAGLTFPKTSRLANGGRPPAGLLKGRG